MLAKNQNTRSGFLGVTLLLALVALPVHAHHGADPVFATPPPPAASAPPVVATGTVDELIVDNHVLNLTARYVALRLDDGQVVVLEGPGSDALPKGARVEATGRNVGNTLFVTETRVVPAAQERTATAAKGNLTTSVQGILRVFHADYFAEGRGEYGLVIQGDDGHATQLNLAVVPDTLRAGMSVIATGSAAANGFSLDVSRITVLAMPRAHVGEPAPASKTNRVLVVPIRFSDSIANPATIAQIQQVFATATNSVANYYNDASYGQQLLDITVANSSGNWLQDAGTTPGSCDFNTIGNRGNAAASAAGYAADFANYDNFYYVMPSDGACGWAGLAYIGFGEAWSNGYNALWVYAHELGHNFRLYHAGSTDCHPNIVGAGCSVAEYGDLFDAMGNNSSQTMHFNAMQKRILGWIPPSSVNTHTSGTATYTLSPLEVGGQATYAVRIPAVTSRTYWIEYRQPIGIFDGGPNGVGSYPNNGAQIRVASPFESSSGADDTELLDTTPGSPGGFGDAALLVGNTYVDSAYGITVQVISATPGPTGSLTLSVSMAGKNPTTTTLTSSANPSIVGTSVTFTATVSGVAPTGTVAFTSDGVTIAGCSAVAFSSGTINAPTATCSISSLTPGKHSIVAAYGGDASNIASSVISALSQIVSSAGLPPPIFINSSFEIPALGKGYQYNPNAAGIGWTFSALSGVQGDGSAWGAAPAPSGTKTAFIQGTGSITQTISLNAGSYTLSFRVAQRLCCVSPFVQPIKVSVDEAQIGSLISPTSRSFAPVSIPFSVGTTGAHTFTFTGTDPHDKTTFIDSVTLQ